MISETSRIFIKSGPFHLFFMQKCFKNTRKAMETSLKHICRPLLARGTKAGFRVHCLLSIGNHCFSSYQAIFYVLRGPKYHHEMHLQITHLGSGFIIKIFLFSSLLSKLKNQKNCSQGFQQKKIQPEIH